MAAGAGIAPFSPAADGSGAGAGGIMAGQDFPIIFTRSKRPFLIASLNFVSPSSSPNFRFMPVSVARPSGVKLLSPGFSAASSAASDFDFLAIAHLPAPENFVTPRLCQLCVALLTFLQTTEPFANRKAESHGIFTREMNANRSQASPVRSEPSLTFFAIQLAERTVTGRIDIQPVQV